MYGPVNPTGPKCAYCGEVVIIYPHHCPTASPAEDYRRVDKEVNVVDYPVIARVSSLAPRRARLTTDHPMSCYGQPVVVVGVQGYSTGEVFWLDGSPEAMEKAAEAGFCVLPSEYSQWPEYYDALPA